MAFNTALVTANAGDDGYELHQDLLTDEGAEVTAGDQGTTTLITNGEFRRDVISVDPATGAITVTEGTETTDATKASAEAPDVPAGEVVLAVGVMTAAGGANEVDSIELDRTGEDASVSGDESHVA